jgi:hypothetical protein
MTPSYTRSEKLIPFAISMVIALITMSFIMCMDDCILVTSSSKSQLLGTSSSEQKQIQEICPQGQFLHQENCRPHLGCNDLQVGLPIFE